MNTTAKAGSLWVIAVSVGVAVTAPSCGDGDPTDVGGGGSSGTGNRGGTSPTGGSGGSKGGSDTGGRAGQGGTTGGSAGSAGSGGSAGSAGMGGEGGEGGQGPGGEGGQGGEPTAVLYDFESGVQGWSTATAGASVSQSTDEHVDGSSSLKITHGAVDGSSVTVQVSGAPVWPGTVITFNAFLPAGLDTTGGTYFQAFSQGNNYLVNFDTSGNSSRTAMPGGLTTWTYTVPDVFPGGLQVLGFQLGDNAGGTTIAAGDVYIDSITATGGVPNCAIATPVGLHDFETSPLDGNVYKVDGTLTTIAQATDRFFMGSGSMKVSFAGLPAPTGTEPTKRIVYIDKPNVYCGQTMTVHVFLPTGSAGMTFQVFAQYNNYGAFTGTGGRTVTQNAWNTATFTIPTVGPGGIQRVGLEFMYSGSAAFTGDVWVDAISW